ncbi:helix-turn-helix domain-containing protein [Pseudoprimorskyibacter insulae]|uniref:Bifunctional transcriptional activator/DNA repair enzyme AdaA n=1 Tax=Pseudoprimorskyibacter insulae TaxID=1695997 RepID=A0A2R8AWF0_9RHOB|nr:AraC family transcriptional regulator [Pseudoprimorskyibacter insulae]SPF80376.1 Bifunctional transcriptional activator/DNA repair enzyme AdaA [Pseudoprimorskyibacter insulae]
MRQPGVIRVPNAGQSAMVPRPIPNLPVRSATLAQLCDGGWRTRLNHSRDDHLVIWITRGQGVVTVDGVRRGVGAHNALYLPAGTLLSLEFGPQTLGLVVLATCDDTGSLPSETLHLRVRDSMAQAELTSEIEAMQREQVQQRPLMEEALAARLAPIGVWLRRQDLAGASDAPPKTAARRLVRHYARLVASDFRDTLTMAHFAERLEVTPTHLARVCRDCCGKTAADLLTERRLHAAKTELMTRDDPIKDIAAGLGFQSAAYFTRFMQQHEGLTPSATRRALRSQAH